MLHSVSKYKILFCASMLLLPAKSVSAAPQPSWVTLLPFGEISCEVKQASGLKWNQDQGHYFWTQYPNRKYIIQRLDPAYSGGSCDKDDTSNYSAFEDSYSRDVCYRYNNVSNFVGWAEGWCRETYMRTGPIYVTCDFKAKLTTKIGFSPSAYFYSYGHVRHHATLSLPGLEDIFTEKGTCKTFSKGYRNKFKVFGKTAKYPPGN